MKRLRPLTTYLRAQRQRHTPQAVKQMRDDFSDLVGEVERKVSKGTDGD